MVLEKKCLARQLEDGQFKIILSYKVKFEVSLEHIKLVSQTLK